jgi:hypothetical protein
LSRLDGSLGSLAARINNVQITPPTFNLPTGFISTAANAAAPPAPFRAAPTFQFNRAPGSAVGSIVHNDGIVNLHKGNVVFPARLSRQRPGDWLEQAGRINSPARDTSRRDGGSFSNSSLSLSVTNNINITGGDTSEGTVAAVRAEMNRQRSELESLIERRTNPARLERDRRFRAQLEKERS